MPNVLSPRKRNFTTLRDFLTASRFRHEDIAGEDRDDDPHMIKEIRRRVQEMAHEFAELGVL